MTSDDHCRSNDPGGDGNRVSGRGHRRPLECVPLRGFGWYGWRDQPKSGRAPERCGVALMPYGPKGEWRPADTGACAVHVMKIATGQIDIPAHVRSVARRPVAAVPGRWFHIGIPTTGRMVAFRQPCVGLAESAVAGRSGRRGLIAAGDTCRSAPSSRESPGRTVRTWRSCCSSRATRWSASPAASARRTTGASPTCSTASRCGRPTCSISCRSSGSSTRSARTRYTTWPPCRSCRRRGTSRC